MTRFVAALGLTSLVVAGCAARHAPLTRDEWLAVATRNYPGISESEFYAAAERVFRHADGDDFTITYTDHRMFAARRWTMYAIFAAASGTDLWVLDTTPETTGVHGSVSISRQSGTLVATPVPGGTPGSTQFTNLPQVGAPIAAPSPYELFWARMDYLLGFSDRWMSCADLAAHLKAGDTWGQPEFLCAMNTRRDHDPPPPPIR